MVRTVAARSARGLTAGLLVLAGLAACSSGPSADEWATQVCGALGPWRTEITSLNSRAATEITATSTSTQARDHLVDLVGGAEKATESARTAVAGAGVPDVDGGGAVAESFVTALAGTRDAYAKAKQELMALDPANEAAFYDGVVNVMGRLTAAYTASSAELTKVSSPELKQAFDGLPACR